MLTVKTTDKEYKVDHNNSEINGTEFTWDIIKVKEGSFHIIKENKSYVAEVLKHDATEKTFTVRVNGNKYDLKIEDRFDALLKQLGMEGMATAKIKDLKAPMPGLVLDIKVAEGDEIKKGDPLLVLEAMKMENIIKSPADVVIASIETEKGAAVEKNQVLINFQ